MRYLFLNRKVQEEVTADPELFLVFQSVYTEGYDPDTVPLHNPDWVAGAQKLEEQKLEYAKRRIAMFKEQLSGKDPNVEMIPSWV